MEISSDKLKVPIYNVKAVKKTLTFPAFEKNS